MKFNSYTEFLNEAFDPSKFLTQEQIDWCNKHIDGSWGVNAKREVTVRRKNVEFKDKSFDRFPVKFAPVKGNFDCDDCPKLISLEGAPSHVGGNFYCDNCPELPDSFMGIIKDYNKKEIDWKMAHKLIHSKTTRAARSLGLI